MMDPNRYTGPARELARNHNTLEARVSALEARTLDGVDFSSDTSAERAASMVAAGELTVAQVRGIEGSGKGGSVTVKDLEEAAEPEAPEGDE